MTRLRALLALLKRPNEGLNAVRASPDVPDILARDSATARPGTPRDFQALKFESKSAAETGIRRSLRIREWPVVFRP